MLQRREETSDRLIIGALRKKMKSKLRVAHLIYSKMVGGSEMVAANICSHLDRTRFEPLVFFLYDKPGTMDEVLAGMGIPSYEIGFGRFTKWLKRLQLPGLLRKYNVDILHIHHVPLYSAIETSLHRAGLRGVIVTEHACFSISNSLFLQEKARTMVERVDGVTVISGKLKNYFVDSLRVDGNRIRVIPNGVDTEVFSPRQGALDGYLLADLQLSRPVLLTVGRLAEAKDHLNLLEAAALLRQRRKEFSVLVVGDGELRGRLEEMRDSLGLSRQVVFAGTRSDVSAILRSCDIFVLPSKREGLPMVVLEAMASGVPVVATTAGGIDEVITDQKNGLLVPTENPESLAQALESLLDDSATARRLGNSGRETAVRLYSLKKIAAQYALLYDTVAAGKYTEQQGTS